MSDSETAEERRASHVAKVLAEAPPLTEEQKTASPTCCHEAEEALSSNPNAETVSESPRVVLEAPCGPTQIAASGLRLGFVTFRMRRSQVVAGAPAFMIVAQMPRRARSDSPGRHHTDPLHALAAVQTNRLLVLQTFRPVVFTVEVLPRALIAVGDAAVTLVRDEGPQARDP